MDKTIRFYTKGRYMGWLKLTRTNVYNARNWVRSGNDVKIGSKLINCPDYLRQLSNTL